jgi:hypothetical protein
VNAATGSHPYVPVGLLLLLELRRLVEAGTDPVRDGEYDDRRQERGSVSPS